MVVLATKVYVDGRARERALDALRSMLADDLGGLEVKWSLGIRHDEFPSVTVEGPDATAARNLLREEWGEVASSRETGETYVGTLDAWDDEGFELDAGEPVRVSAESLGLGPGTPAQVRERYGMVQHLRLGFVQGEPPRLSDAQRDRLYDWTRGPGRVNVNSATRSEVRATVNRAGHAEDVVAIERLGLLEHSIVCAEGTDPPGLLASIGDYLRSELRCVVTD